MKRDPLADAAPVENGTKRPSPKDAEDPKTAEQRCGIDANMNGDEKRDQLAKMFRRFNRLASSLDSESRSEAEYMLDLIVEMREKHLN